MTPDNSVILVGMPGAGKSTIGILLAKELAKDFIDTDLLIQLQQGKTLQDIIEEQDYLALRKIEEGILLGMAHRNHVIATGGSAVYSNTGMTHLKSEEHTSELQSRENLVCRLLLEKKKRRLAQVD